MKKSISILSAFLFLLFLANISYAETWYAKGNDASGKCMTCHKEKTHGLYNQWKSSAHAQHNVTCID